MKETIYWWIEKSNGNLAQNAREIINSEIWEGGAPKLFFWRRDAKDHCRTDEHPVKIKLVKVDKGLIMKTKPMRLWAVVIGEKWKDNRYVCHKENQTDFDNLAVYKTWAEAIKERRKTLLTCGHKHVYVIPFDSK